jgi:hypothetical protein
MNPMKLTWASGAIELLRHADSHIYLETAFDRRIAFISIDNAVETLMRTFLSLPVSKAGVKVARKDFDEVENSFRGLTALLWEHAGARLTGIDDADIEHYHRIRNTLYHNGTGLSVDDQYLLAYRQIAVLLLKNLFGLDLGEPRPAPTLERLIVIWNQIQETLDAQLNKRGIARHGNLYWEEARHAGIITGDDLKRIKELRLIRNGAVHSSEVDRKQIEDAVQLAESVLSSLKSR